MITFPTSFQNANGDEAAAIGHMFSDRNSTTRYVEVAQAEDYVMFRLVDESEDQRYGFEHYRKVTEARVHIDNIPSFVSLIDESLEYLENNTSEYRYVVSSCMFEGTQINFTMTEVGVTIGMVLGFGKVLKVRLDMFDTNKLSSLLSAFVRDYEDYINNRVFVTATLREWHAVLDNLDGNWPAHEIEEAIRDSIAQNPEDVVTVELPDQYEADHIADLMVVRYEWSVDEWRRVLEGLRDNREWDLYSRLREELGFFSDLGDPRGCTGLTMLETELSFLDQEKVQRACYLAAVSGR